MESLVPQASTWFDASPKYEGDGCLVLGNGQGALVGKGAVACDVYATETTLSDVSWPDHDDIDLLGLIMGHRDFGALQLKTANGTLRSEGSVEADRTATLFSRKPPLIKPHLWRYTYRASGASEPVYWVLPLVNFLPDLHQSHADLDRHPLRIYPTPKLSAKDGASPLQVHVSQSRNRLALFREADRLGFIEHLPEHGSMQQRLKNKETPWAITSVMVGQIGERPCTDWHELGLWLPTTFLRLLSMLSGSVVGSPWIETRDRQGNLCSRFHYGMSKAPFHKGHRAMHNLHSSRIGLALTGAATSRFWPEPRLRGLLHLVTRGLAYELYSLDDRLDFLTRACELAFVMCGVDRGQLCDGLPSDVLSLIRGITNDARQQTSDIRCDQRFSLDGPSRSTVNRIAQLVPSPDASDGRFSSKLRCLLRHMNLDDEEAMSKSRFGRGKKQVSWMHVLNQYRNAITHEGGATYRVRARVT